MPVETQRSRMENTINAVRRQIKDERWEIGFFVDRDSVWFEARIAAKGVAVQRASEKSLIETVNSITVAA